ncbi:right-handed parallel beta-helix repeat-containing protein [Paenibacillus sp. 1P07SE]|uniref:right-handed parallel beta-helix repeat-containing protein n=1 Tax=Paenibacillus sp. 1P07SE TaxID=3132209 RepID=UPI0039A738F6
MNKEGLQTHHGLVTVGGDQADIRGLTGKAIQLAVDALAHRGGGTVKLMPGVFEIDAPVRLASHITLAGSGEATLLRKTDGVQSRLAIDPGFGQLWVDVEDGSLFRPGMGLLVRDNLRPYGWEESTAVITRVERNRLYLDRRLANNYERGQEGLALSACSMIEAVDAEQVTICDLVLDGNRENNGYIGGCRGGGVYLFGVKKARIANVTVRAFGGDGISWQATENVDVVDCEVTGCAGSGLHPGSRSTGSRILTCTCRDNTEDGLFVCWMVQEATIQGNKFLGNARHGISIGHQDTDNLFAENLVSGNGGHGIYARPETEGNGAHRNRFLSNTVEDNGRGEGAGFYMEGVTRDWEIVGNTIRSTKPQGQAYAIVLQSGASCHHTGNRMEGHRQDVYSVAGEHEGGIHNDR